MIAMGCLYQITSPSGKSYIGITSGKLKDRWRAHRANASRSKDGALQKAIVKYGAHNMIVRELVIVDDYEYLKDLEKKAIVAYGTKAPNGYNLTDGGDGVLGVVVTEEGRLRRSHSQKKSYANPERKATHRASQQSPEVRAARSKASSDYFSNDTVRENLSAVMKEMWNKPEYLEKMAKRATKPKIEDGLDKSQRYRLKDVEAYRDKKNAYAKTPEQKAKRTEYMKKWREANQAKQRKDGNGN